MKPIEPIYQIVGEKLNRFMMAQNLRTLFDMAQISYDGY